MDFEFEHEKSYGQDRFYPVNENAKRLLNIMGKKGIGAKTFSEIQKSGWNVLIRYKAFVGVKNDE